MVRDCGLDNHIEGDEVIPERFLENNQPNPAYNSWEREHQLVLSWIVASVSKGILPKLVGAETTQRVWTKLVTAYASGLRPQICELKAQLHNMQRENARIESYIIKAKGISDRLAAL